MGGKNNLVTVMLTEGIKGISKTIRVGFNLLDTLLCLAFQVRADARKKVTIISPQPCASFFAEVSTPPSTYPSLPNQVYRPGH